METRHTGQDFQVNVTVKAQEGGSISVADLQGLLIYIIHDKGKILKKFSQNTLTGFGAITLEQSGDDVLCKVQIERSDTIDADLGIYHVEVKIQTEDEAFTDDQLHTIAIKEEIFLLEKAHSRSQALL